MCISKAVLFKDVTQTARDSLSGVVKVARVFLKAAVCDDTHLTTPCPKPSRATYKTLSQQTKEQKGNQASQNSIFITVYFYTSMLHACACCVCLYMHSLACMPVENREQFVELAFSSHHVGHGRLTRLPDKCLYPLSYLSGSSQRNDTFKLCFV